MANKDEKAKDPEKTPDTGAKETPAEARKEPTVEERLDLLSAELAEVKDKYLRALADMENFKKRNNEDTAREKKYAAMPICGKLIDHLEVFDQAVSVPTEDPQFKNFLYGFKMIRDMLYGVLQDEGVTQIDLKVGDPFDPNLAHAIETINDPEQPDHAVVKIAKKGYRFKDRLLRPAMVVINLRPAPAKEAQPQNPGNNPDNDNNPNVA